MKNITQEEWRELLSNDDDAVIIDSRTPNEWRAGVFENSLLMNINDPQSFMDDVNKLDKEKNYYVYCRSGIRSIQACQVLESVGIKTTYNLLGGILIWNGKTVIP
ncbi:MAG: rhodanese-like domain-containing protein [Bacteroidetes bacterium]|nr:MAG: rhodanese-like domain-containing protein [Bacteroidota bacterium]